MKEQALVYLSVTKPKCIPITVKEPVLVYLFVTKPKCTPIIVKEQVLVYQSGTRAACYLTSAGGDGKRNSVANRDVDV